MKPSPTAESLPFSAPPGHPAGDRPPPSPFDFGKGTLADKKTPPVVPVVRSASRPPLLTALAYVGLVLGIGGLGYEALSFSVLGLTELISISNQAAPQDATGSSYRTASAPELLDRETTRRQHEHLRQMRPYRIARMLLLGCSSITSVLWLMGSLSILANRLSARRWLTAACLPSILLKIGAIAVGAVIVAANDRLRTEVIYFDADPAQVAALGRLAVKDWLTFLVTQAVPAGLLAIGYGIILVWLRVSPAVREHLAGRSAQGIVPCADPA